MTLLQRFKTPARDYDIDRSELEITCRPTHIDSTNQAKVPYCGFLAKRLMARSEPLIQEADPHITKHALGAWMSLKMVQKKYDQMTCGIL